MYEIYFIEQTMIYRNINLLVSKGNRLRGKIILFCVKISYNVMVCLKNNVCEISSSFINFAKMIEQNFVNLIWLNSAKP